MLRADLLGELLANLHLALLLVVVRDPALLVLARPTPGGHALIEMQIKALDVNPIRSQIKSPNIEN